METEKEPQTPDDWITFFQEQYNITKNPVFVLGAFCHIPQTIHGNVIIPAWIADCLVHGFNHYLTGLTAGGGHTLGTAMGIAEDETIKRTSLDKMVDYVHLYRWLFGLKSGNAIRAVYGKYDRDIVAMGLQKEHQGVTRSGKSFSDYYNRNHANKYEAWATSAKDEELTEENRQVELAFLDKDTARFVKSNSPHYQTR